MRNYKKLLDFMQGVTEWILVVLVAAMVVIVSVQVFCRFVLRGSLPWSEEASRYIMIWLSMLGASIGLRLGAHVGVEAVVKFLGVRVRHIVQLLAGVVCLFFCGGLVAFGWRLLTIVQRQTSPAMGISMVWPYGALIVGGALMVLYVVEILGNELMRKAAPKGGARL